MLKILEKHYNKYDRLREALDTLDGAMVSYTALNKGMHIRIVYDNTGYIDYWPTHGKWIAYTSTGEKITWEENTRFLVGVLNLLGISYEVVV